MSAEYGHSVQLLVAIYFNKQGLSQILEDCQICTPQNLSEFVLGMNLASPLFVMCDVGPGKEAADAKLRGGYLLPRSVQEQKTTHNRVCPLIQSSFSIRLPSAVHSSTSGGSMLLCRISRRLLRLCTFLSSNSRPPFQDQPCEVLRRRAARAYGYEPTFGGAGRSVHEAEARQGQTIWTPKSSTSWRLDSAAAEW